MSAAIAEAGPPCLRRLPFPNDRRVPPLALTDAAIAEPESAPGSGGYGQIALPLALTAAATFVPAYPDEEDLAPWAHRLGQAVIEVIYGVRNPGQLSRWTTPQMHAKLLRRSQIAQHCDPGSQRRRPVVRTVVLSRPHRTACEASVVFSEGDRTRAIAMRLERQASRWRVTVLDFG